MVKAQNSSSQGPAIDFVRKTSSPREIQEAMGYLATGKVEAWKGTCMCEKISSHMSSNVAFLHSSHLYTPAFMYVISSI